MGFRLIDDLHVTHPLLDHGVITMFEGNGGFTMQENVFTMAENVVFNPSDIFTNPVLYGGLATQQPFVLANPHHTMDWTKTFGNMNSTEVRTKVHEAQIKQLEAVKSQMHDQLKQIDSQIESMKSELENFRSSRDQSEQG